MSAPMNRFSVSPFVLLISVLLFQGCDKVQETLPESKPVVQQELPAPPPQPPQPVVQQPPVKPEPEPEVVQEPVDWAAGVAHASSSHGKLAMIVGALHQHDKKYGCFWPDMKRGPELYDSNRNLLVSWRVHLLPFLGQRKLYDRFRLSEPWDSKHNLSLMDKMPDVFRSSPDDEPNHTRFGVFIGSDAPMFIGRQIGIKDVLDGSVNTILVAEAGPDRAVPWTKPEEMPFDPRSVMDSLGKISPVGINVVTVAGKTYTLRPDIKAAEIAELITHVGKEDVKIEDFQVDLESLLKPESSAGEATSENEDPAKSVETESNEKKPENDTSKDSQTDAS